MSILDRDYFKDEEKAFAKLESVLWPKGPECPHCGVVNDAHRIAANPDKKVRHGLYRCNACKEQFTVTVGTVFESSHIPVHKWMQVAYLLCSSKKGISAKQIERTLGVTYKTAWFMMHRLREAMSPVKPGPLGGEGKTIEADETYFGKRARPSGKSTFVSGFGWVSPSPRYGLKKVVTLVERGGSARSFHVDRATKATVRDILLKNADRASTLMTDEAPIYDAVGHHYAAHYTVEHGAEEWVRDVAYTNTVEGFFSIFKRGMKGVYQHCSEKHLHRYLAEFDFRYNAREALGVDDVARTDRALAGAQGKRLTYRWPD
jgi:transposase-like protein